MSRGKRFQKLSSVNEGHDFLIMTNGKKSETAYFTFLGNKSIFHVTIEFHNGDLKELVRYAVTKVGSYNQIWCVFDTDSTPNKNHMLDGIILASKHHIRLGYSNPSFEVWLLNHFEEVNPNDSVNDFIRKINTQIHKTNPLMDYDKGNADLTKNIFIPLYKTAYMKSKAKYQTLTKENKGSDSSREWEWSGTTNLYKLIDALMISKK